MRRAFQATSESSACESRWALRRAQQSDDPTRWYSPVTAADPADTGDAHYETWRDAVAGMMAEPRSSTRYENLFPDDQGWG
jgi:hypothetical protein